MPTLEEQYRAQQQAKGVKSGNYNVGFAAPINNTVARPAPTQVARPKAPGFVEYAGRVGKQTLGIAASGGKALGGFVKNTGIDIARDAALVLRTPTDIVSASTRNSQIAARQKALTSKQDQIVKAYKTGKMSKDNYKKSMQDLSKGFAELSKNSKSISDETGGGDRALALIETAATALSLGSFTAVKAGGKQVLDKGIQRITTKAIGDIEKTITRVPAARELVERNAVKVVTRQAQKAAGESTEQWLAREGKRVAIGLLIKRPLFYQSNIGLAGDTYEHILENDYAGATKSAAWIGAQMIGGGPIGYALNSGKKAIKEVGKLAKGQGSVIDELSAQIGNGNRAQIANYISKKSTSTPAATGTLADLPKGYRTELGSVFDPKGRELTIGEVQELTQPKYLTAFERASNAGDQATMKRIAREHPGDKRVHIGTTENIVGNSERTYRILQETNLRAANGDAKVAAQNILAHYDAHGIPRTSLTAEMIERDYSKWAEADALATKTIKQGVIKGVSPEDVAKYAVVRWDTATRNALANAIENSGGSNQEALEIIQKFAENPAVGWGNNDILMAKLMDIVGTAQSKAEIVNAIRGITTASTLIKGVPKKIAQQLSDMGYTIAAPFGGNKIARIDYEDVENSTRKLISSAVQDEAFDMASRPLPALQTVNGLMTKAGISPEGSVQLSTKKLSEALIGDLDNLQLRRDVGLVGAGGNFVNGGKAMLSELQRYVETKKGAFLLNKISSGKSAVTDIRQLTADEISTALQITKSQAKDVSRAIRDAYTKVPLEYRGLGDRIVDYAIAAPLSPMRYYLRVQSAFRYTYNPFFRFQEQVETNILASMRANKFIWASKSLDDTVDELERFGVFSGNIFGAGADDAVIGRISANLTKYQKRNLAGLAETIAKGQNKTVFQVLQESPDQIEDALRIIVQYPKEGGLASPLARTLNVLFFPMRYNIKVSTLAAEKLATLPPSLQIATLQAYGKAKEWLKSDEGIQWQSDNAEAIKVWQWASPVGNIQQFMKILSGNASSLGEMGLLGGLPFGFISTILDGQGIINLNKPYVNPSTGDVIPDYIPQSTKARSAVALQDLLGTMFSFPGRTLGLPGKEANLRKVVEMFIDANGADFEKRLNMDELTPLQKNWVRVLKGDTSDEAVDALYYAPADGQFDYYTIPPMDLPIVKPLGEATVVPKRTGLPERSRAPKGPRVKPLAQPIPQR